MNLVDLQALLSLAQSGSLQGAAQATGVPRTTLRRRLDRLHDELGEPLFSIGAQGVKLMPAGQLLVQRAPRLISQHEALIEEARCVARQPVGLLRVLLATGFPPTFVAQVTSSLATVAPDLRLEFHHDPQPLNRLDEGFDVVVHWGDPPPPRDGFSRVLIRQQRILLATAGYLDRRGTPSSIEELGEHSLLHLASEARVWPLRGGGVLPIEPTLTTDDFYLLGCLAGADLGLAFLPQSGVGIDATIASLVPVLEDKIGSELVVRVFLPMKTLTGSAPRAILDMIRGLWDGLPVL